MWRPRFTVITPHSVLKGRDPARMVLDDVPNSFFCVDLLDNRCVPSAYSLRHYNKDGHCLRFWKLLGSTNGSSWEMLSDHNNDQTLQKANQTATWRLKDSKKAYRFFRVQQYGKNSSGAYHNLCCAG